MRLFFPRRTEFVVSVRACYDDDRPTAALDSGTMADRAGYGRWLAVVAAGMAE